MLSLGLHPKIKIPVPNAGWICSTDYPQSRDVLQPRVISMIGEDNIKDWNEVAKELYLNNGSIISFKSYDSGWEKFRSAGKHWIFFDEEPPERVWKESIIRWVDEMPHIFVTMTPEKGHTWVYKKYFQKQSATKSSFHFTSTFLNPYLKKEELDVIQEGWTEEEKRMFLHGEFVSLSGMCIFELGKYSYEEIIRRDKEALRGTIVVDKKRTYRERVNFVRLDNRSAGLKIYREPSHMERYFLGADVGEGLSDGNFSVAQVINERLQHCAEYRGRVPPDEFANIIYGLGKYYNTALAGVEKNAHGLTTVTYLKKDYPVSRLWASTAIWTKREEEDQDRFGWDTNERTKPFLINNLRRVLRDGSLEINSPTLFEELSTYVRLTKGKIGADYGCFDDTVMSMGIAVSMWFEKMYGRPQAMFQALKEAIGIKQRRRIGNLITGY
ncbi:MAG: hypothetical protein DDT23_00618 [candidate division WS2 bacterium]|nr:hypothetical protein [Candidatus Lithacetigena glycinireducens]